MAKILPIPFPCNLGFANELIIKTLPFSMEDDEIYVTYELRDTNNITSAMNGPGSLPYKLLASGRIKIIKEVYANWGIDNSYIISWVADQLGITLDPS